MPWGSNRYSHCTLNHTMQDLGKLAGTASRYKTGGLGRLMVDGVFESWVCLPGHECSPRPDEVRVRWDLVLCCAGSLLVLCSRGMCHKEV